jgi:hypothetical protein
VSSRTVSARGSFHYPIAGALQDPAFTVTVGVIVIDIDGSSILTVI